jgi:hypothetical protein
MGRLRKILVLGAGMIWSAVACYRFCGYLLIQSKNGFYLRHIMRRLYPKGYCRCLYNLGIINEDRR